jgi:DNA modification methylase
MKIVNRKIKDLIRAEYNPRELTKDQYNHLKDSLLRFGVVDPVIVNKHPDRDNIIIGGHQRSKVWEDMGNDKIPTVELSLTLDKEKELNVRLNKNTGQFDMDMLANHFDTSDLLEWGFDEGELVGFDALELEAEEDEFDVPDGGIDTDIVPGDLFEIGEHRLLCGDSTNSDALEKLMGDERADMVFTDPPWNVNYGAVKEGNAMGYKPRTIMNDSMSTDDFKDFMGSTFAMMAMYSKKGCPTYVVMSAQEWGNLMLALHENQYHWSSTIIWNKSHLVMSRKDYHTKYEPIWYGWLEGAPRLCPLKDRKQSDVWDVDRPTKSELHPTTKPIELVNIALKNSSYKGNLIMELFTGSGSTMVASHQLNRKCYGMELDPKYCQVIVNRMMKLDDKLVVKLNGKPYEKELVSL